MKKEKYKENAHTVKIHTDVKTVAILADECRIGWFQTKQRNTQKENQKERKQKNTSLTQL